MNNTDINLPLWLAFIAANEAATRDWLTGLYNRRYFEETLNDHIQAAHRYERELSLVLFDINDFKQINDSRGHEAGDAVLRQFADLLKSTVRKADIACRYGGDEFAVILPETDISSARTFAARFQQASNIATASGIAALPCENLVAIADADLLAKKQTR